MTKQAVHEKKSWWKKILVSLVYLTVVGGIVDALTGFSMAKWAGFINSATSATQIKTRIEEGIRVDSIKMPGNDPIIIRSVTQEKREKINKLAKIFDKCKGNYLDNIKKENISSLKELTDDELLMCFREGLIEWAEGMTEDVFRKNVKTVLEISGPESSDQGINILNFFPDAQVSSKTVSLIDISKNIIKDEIKKKIAVQNNSR